MSLFLYCWGANLSFNLSCLLLAGFCCHYILPSYARPGRSIPLIQWGECYCPANAQSITWKAVKHPLISKNEFKETERVKVHEGHVWKCCSEVRQRWNRVGWSKGARGCQPSWRWWLSLFKLLSAEFWHLFGWSASPRGDDRRQSHEEDMVKISKAVGCFFCHTVRIQQLQETTEQQKFLSPFCWLMCAALSCRSFFLPCSGSAVTYLEEKWGFVSVLLKILQSLKSCRHPEYKLWLWAAGKKTEEGKGERNPYPSDFA